MIHKSVNIYEQTSFKQIVLAVKTGIMLCVYCVPALVILYLVERFVLVRWARIAVVYTIVIVVAGFALSVYRKVYRKKVHFEKLVETVTTIYDRDVPITDMQGMWEEKPKEPQSIKQLRTALIRIVNAWQTITGRNQDAYHLTHENDGTKIELQKRLDWYYGQEAKEGATIWLQNQRWDQLLAKSVTEDS